MTASELTYSPLRRAEPHHNTTAPPCMPSSVTVRAAVRYDPCFCASAPMAAGTSTQTGIRLQLLGEPKLDLGGEAFPLERKDAALLALLAVDGATTRGKAAALLWPDVDDDAARNNLRQRLHRLRRRAGRDVAVTTADVLRLADGVSHDLSNATELLAQDAGSVAGELLGSLDYADCEQLDEWLRAAREHWRGTRRNALAEIAAKLEREGHIALALQYSERLLADDPLREHAHRQLMRLHYLRGDRAAALAVFERCRELLQRELGTTAGNETLELAALIESSGTLPSPAVVAKPVSVLRPPKLVGRDAEWSELEIAWQQKRFALVCGEPGIGKTRLLSDFVARHDGAIIVGARPGDARVPFALLARLLRRSSSAMHRSLRTGRGAELESVAAGTRCSAGKQAAAGTAAARCHTCVAHGEQCWSYRMCNRRFALCG